MDDRWLAGVRTRFSNRYRGKVPVAPEELGHRAEQILPAAVRYFPVSEVMELGWQSLVLPCAKLGTQADDQVPVYLVIEQDNIGFFEPEDIEARNIAGRTPFTANLNDLAFCRMLAPEGLRLTIPEMVSIPPTPQGLGLQDIALILGIGSSTHTFLIQYGSGQLTAQEKANVCLLYTSPSPRD